MFKKIKKTFRKIFYKVDKSNNLLEMKIEF